jgi:Fanconi anemia group D2 protein
VLSRYSLFAASVLDHIESMSLDEVRRVVDILSRLAFFDKSSSAATGLRDDLHIVVRKQISSSKTFLKRMGVVGAVAVVKNLSPGPASKASDQTSLTSTLASTSTQKGSASFR